MSLRELRYSRKFSRKLVCTEINLGPYDNDITQTLLFLTPSPPGHAFTGNLQGGAKKVRKVDLNRSHFYKRQDISMVHGLFERPKKRIL